MSRVPRDEGDIQDLLQQQLELLQVLVRSYDSGESVTGKSIASCLRVLAHHTPSSHALLAQAGLLDRDFYDTAELRQEHDGDIWAGSYSALIGVAFGGEKSGFVPNLDSSTTARYTPFPQYWQEVVFTDKTNNSFSRKDVVLAVANQDGGSHVDPRIDPKYKDLSRNNSLGHFIGNAVRLEALRGAELAAIRQIAHEFLKTLIDDYETPRPEGHGIIVGGIGLVLHTGPAQEAPRRKGPCPCGSGKKYKRCHGS